MTYGTYDHLSAAPRWRVALIALCSIVFTAASIAADTAKEVAFDIPAAAAAKALRQFSAQSGQQLIYANADLAGITTNELKGRMTVAAALVRLLAGTPLVASPDSKNGAVAVARASPEKSDPNVKRAAQTTASDRPNQSRAGRKTPVADRNPDDDDAIVLSPFEVSTTKDHGYQATSSLSGGRLATDLDKTPAAVSVMTREFLDDIGALTVQEALQWATNAVAANETDVTFESGSGTARTGVPSLATDNGNIIRTRGIRDSSLARNYFVWVVDSHGYNTERIDISRGPNALIFGDASTGGIVNITTKRAKPRPFTELSFQILSEGGGLATLDVNRPLTESFSVRLNALFQDSDGWMDFMRDDRKGLFLSTAWTAPTKRTQVRVEGEWGWRNRRMPVAYFLDRSSSWNHQYTLAGRLTGSATPPGATGALRNDTGSRLLNQPFMVLDAANPSAGLTDYQGFARTNGTQSPAIPGGLDTVYAALNPAIESVQIDESAVLGGAKTFPVLPNLAWSINLPGRELDINYATASAFVEQRLGENLYVELATNIQSFESKLHQMQDANRVFYDINEVLPSGAPNPNFLKPFVEGAGFRLMRTQQEVWETRASAVYLLNTRLTQQRIGGLVSYRKHHFFRDFARLVRVNGPDPDVSLPENLIRIRSYLDERGASMEHLDVDGTYMFGPSRVKFLNYRASGARGSASSGSLRGRDSRLWSAQIFASGDWLESKRIHTVAGVRRDYLTSFDIGLGDIDPVTREVLNRRKQTVGPEDWFTSSSVGAVVRLNPWLSLFANYSESFVAGAASGVDVYGDTLEPQRGIGTDVGLKLSLLGGAVTGSVGYYDTFEKNNRISNPAVGSAINQIWNEIGSLELISAGTPDTQLASATGYELEIMANIKRNWSIMFNLGIPTSELEDAVPAFRRYLSEHRPEWEAIAADPGTPAAVRDTINSRLAIIDAQLDTLSDGRPVKGVADWNANCLTRYRFLSGPLKDLTVGGGVNWVDRRFIGSRTVGGDTVFDYSERYKRLTAFAAYEAKLWGVDWRFQLNVDNLLDDEEFRYTNLNPDGTGLQYRVQAPRSYRLSTRVRF